MRESDIITKISSEVHLPRTNIVHERSIGLSNVDITLTIQPHRFLLVLLFSYDLTFVEIHKFLPFSSDIIDLLLPKLLLSY